MNELIRFLMMRPANATTSDQVKVVGASYVEGNVTRVQAVQAAKAFVAAGRLLLTREGVENLKPALALLDKLKSGPAALADAKKAVEDAAAAGIADLIGSESFKTDERKLQDSLFAMKVLSNSLEGDAPDLGRLIQAFDAIRAINADADPIALRPLSLPKFAPPDRQLPAGNNDAPIDKPPPGQAVPAQEDVGRFDNAIAALSTLPVTAFSGARDQGVAGMRSEVAALGARLDEMQGRRVDQAAVRAGASGATTDGRPWTLTGAAIAQLPKGVQATLESHGIDLTQHSLPGAMLALHNLRAQSAAAAAPSPVVGRSMKTLGKALSAIGDSDYVGDPNEGLPLGTGNIRPVGVGDLLMVKEHVLRYEGGDLAHVENVMKTEHLSRDTRRFEHTETSLTQETEVTKEEQRDTQTTDRFSLKREVDTTVQSDTQFKAGLAVDAKYGPFVEVKANADFSTQQSDQESVKQASEFSKDVVDRSVSKVVQRVLERRTTTTITEFEEKYSHGFDNTAGAGHVSGFYQWVDKVMQAQVYNYGKRMLFDVTVPEPGTAYILLQTQGNQAGKNLVEPPPFSITADQLTEANYRMWGHTYDVTGLEPPPDAVATYTKALDAAYAQDPHEGTKSDTIAIAEGYAAQYALFQRTYVNYSSGFNEWQVLIGSNWIDATSGTGYVAMGGETGSVPIGYVAYQFEELAATIEIFCSRTDRALQAWQLKMHAAITQGYLAKKQAYDQALAEATAAAGTVISGKNSLFNQRTIATELRKQCLTLLTSQQFEAFGALELSPEGYAQPNLYQTTAQMPFVRFFEQAFEWEHLVYFFYPYFWGWKPAWKLRALLDDVDPDFADFLRAGAARVVFPVRPGFEGAVAHYLETGEIWNGGPPPDITSPLYVPIVKEIQEATGAPGNEVPVGDPWLVRLPTTLVRIRPNDDLPEWKKVGEDWQAAN
jgi:hypothetical protein